MRIQRKPIYDLILATFRNNEEIEHFLRDQPEWGDKIANAVPNPRIAFEEYAWETADRLVRWGCAVDYVGAIFDTRHLPIHIRMAAGKILGRELTRELTPDPPPPAPVPSPVVVPTVASVPTPKPIQGKRRMKRRIAKKIIDRIAKGDYPSVRGYECAPGHHPWLRRHEAQRARQRAQLATVPRRLGVEYFAHLGRSAKRWDHFVRVWTAPMLEPPYPIWRGGYYVGARPCP